jgi:hypothetical protein
MSIKQGRIAKEKVMGLFCFGILLIKEVALV